MGKRGGNARRQNSIDRANEYYQTRNNSNNTNNKYNHELFSSLNALPYFTYEQAQLFNELLKQQKQNKRSNNHSN